MAEITSLQKHIFNYAKTREVYMEYRKSGYTKKFYEEHVEELLLHKTAMEAFDKEEGKRIPTVKKLREEYGRLVDSNRSFSSNYRKMKQERKDISVIRANIDVLLTGIDDKDVIKGELERKMNGR